MLVFAYTVLVLILAAIAAVYAYRYYMLQAQVLWKARSERMRRSQAQALAAVADIERQVKEIDHRTRKEMGFSAPPANPFSKSEERHARELKQVVSVNDRPVTLSAS